MQIVQAAPSAPVMNHLRPLSDQPIHHELFIIFARRLEGGFGILHEGVGALCVMRKEGGAGTDGGPQFLSIDIERFDE